MLINKENKMNNRKQNSFGTIVCLLLIILASIGLASAQPPVKEKPTAREKIPTGPPACTSDDKVEVTHLVLNPTQARVGQSVTSTMTIKNKCPNGTADIDVPWKLYVDDQTIRTGTAKISAGGSASVSGPWAAVAGSHRFYGAADLKNEKVTSNNILPDVIINVPQSSVVTKGKDSGGQPQMETQVLDYQKAKDAGAQFSDGVKSVVGCQAYQIDPAYRPGIYAGNSVAFELDCAGGFGLTGAKGDPEAFINFTLKHGWKIKLVETSQPDKTYCNGNATWQWMTRPKERPDEKSDNPYMQMHLVAEGSQCQFRVVKVTIEGPVGTNPYHN